MNRAAPYTIAALVFVSAAAWSFHLAVAPEPLATSSAAVVAIGLLIHALIAVTGLLLSRGRWSKNLGIAVAGGGLVLGVMLEPGPWYIAGITASAAAIAGLTGPWLQGWVRKLPAADGPGTRAIVLVFAALGVVPALGLAAPSGLDPTHGVLGGAALLFAWGYARAQVWALWSLRLALPVLAIGSIVRSPWGGRVLLVVLVAVVTALAWSREADRAVRPLLDRLPGPRIGTPTDRGVSDGESRS